MVAVIATLLMVDGAVGWQVGSSCSEFYLRCYNERQSGYCIAKSWGLYYKTFYGSNCCRIIIS